MDPTVLTWVLVIWGVITLAPLTAVQMALLFSPHGAQSKEWVIGKPAGLAVAVAVPAAAVGAAASTSTTTATAPTTIARVSVEPALLALSALADCYRAHDSRRQQ